MRLSISFRRAFLTALLVLACSTHGVEAATITIVNLDGVGEGFNDPTPATPVGGNTGSTRGAQRLQVFQRAAQIWGAILPSPVEIRVEARFNALMCDATSAVVGSANATQVDRDFTNAPFTGTWYPIALASKLYGSDRDPGNDIRATFNSVLDSDPNCLGGAGWYYGFDGNEGTAVDLLPVVLHEIAHGLGFATFASASTGALFNGVPDIFTRFLVNTQTGERWTTMSNAERQASAINTGRLVWDGPITVAAAEQVLGPRPVIVVNSPGSIDGTYAAGPAGFGPQSFDVTGEVVLVDDGTAPDSDGCSPLVNGANVAGKIALIDRGTCNFTTKALQAQAAGAIGVIIVDNAPRATPPSLGGTDPSITVPTFGIRQVDGNAIRAEIGTPVNASLRFDTTLRAGTDDDGLMLMYAPNPVESGSSVSHFDVTAAPNLLMEPAINRDLQAAEVDLTRALFADIGWTPQSPVTLADFEAEATTDGITLRWRATEGALESYSIERRRIHPDEADWELRAMDVRVESAGPYAWSDRDVEAGATYAYRLIGRATDGDLAVAGPVLVTFEAPRRALLAVAPNPLRSGDASFQFALPRATPVRLQVFDLAGRLVRDVANGTRAAGLHSAHWDGRDDHGRSVANGVYLARLETSSGRMVSRIAVLR